MDIFSISPMLYHKLNSYLPPFLLQRLNFAEIEDPGVTIDSIFVNWVEVDYYKRFVAEEDRLKFTVRGTGEHSFSISNFTHPNIMVFDVSDPLRVRRLTNPTVTSSEDRYTVRFSDEISGEATYFVVSILGVRDIPYIFQAWEPSLKSPDNGADYIIITHEDFRDAVLPLAQHRQGQGYRVKVVTTQEIYNEFSGGIFTPVAIKDFLRYAYENWRSPAPEFVLLIGDANVDYRDNWDTGEINYVPTYLVETTIVGETPSDNWFVTVAGDDPLPDMLIGRIPAKSISDVDAMVNKIITYETGIKEDWQGHMLFAANDQDPRFVEYSEEWATHLPSNYTLDRIYAGTYTDKAQAKADLIKSLNDGELMTSFFGHGSVDLWASSQDSEFLTSDDAPLLTNQGRYPFVVAFNCLNGLFAEPGEGESIVLPDGSILYYAVPLPEALLFQDGRGALAMWSPAAFAYPSEQRWIGHELFSGLFEQGNNILGSATTLAKVNAYVKKNVYVENLDVFTFFGDPATHLHLDIRKGNSSSGGGGSGGGGCFIATAAYGSYLHPYVRILRDLRDRILLWTRWGERLVEAYYRLSPPMAEWISHREWARRITQALLIPLVFGAWFIVDAPWWFQVAILGLSLLCGTIIFTVNRRRKVTSLIIIVLFLSSMTAGSTVWASPVDSDLHVIRSDDGDLLIELVLPPFHVSRKTSGTKTYDEVTVKDYGFTREIGMPELPMRGTLIAIPEGGDISLDVEPGDYETLWLNIGPSTLAGEESSSPLLDPGVYGQDAFYPGPLVVRGFTGYMREQKVMQIIFYPVQYNPATGEVRIYRRIQVYVDLGNRTRALKRSLSGEKTEGKNTNQPGSAIPGAYERLLKGLILNYP